MRRLLRNEGTYEDFTDEDLQYRIKSFEALARNCAWEIEACERELSVRKEYDASISGQ